MTEKGHVWLPGLFYGMAFITIGLIIYWLVTK